MNKNGIVVGLFLALAFLGGSALGTFHTTALNIKEATNPKPVDNSKIVYFWADYANAVQSNIYSSKETYSKCFVSQIDGERVCFQIPK